MNVHTMVMHIENPYSLRFSHVIWKVLILTTGSMAMVNE